MNILIKMQHPVSDRMIQMRSQNPLKIYNAVSNWVEETEWIDWYSKLFERACDQLKDRNHYSQPPKKKWQPLRS